MPGTSPSRRSAAASIRVSDWGAYTPGITTTRPSEAAPGDVNEAVNRPHLHTPHRTGPETARPSTRGPRRHTPPTGVHPNGAAAPGAS
ncbi:hypothetical protein GCM10022227_11370 [Streptomyces sedi]